MKNNYFILNDFCFINLITIEDHIIDQYNKTDNVIFVAIFDCKNYLIYYHLNNLDRK
jgi:hypothetical protein